MTTSNNKNRFRNVLIALVVIGVGWLLLKRDGEDKPSSKPANPFSKPPASVHQKGVAEATAKPIAGVYKIESYIENKEACEPKSPGPPGETEFLAVEPVPVFGSPAVEVVGCADPAKCEQVREKIRAAKGGNSSSILLYFTEEESPTRLAGINGMGGFADPDKGVCSQRFNESLLLTIPESGMLRLEIRRKNLPDLPLGERGCSINGEAIKAEAAPLPCSSMRVFTARKMR